MRIKLDENLGRRVKDVFLTAGHDPDTVRDEGLAGVNDEAVFNAATGDRRVLVTLDHDFGNPLHFSHRESEGVVILEYPQQGGYEVLLNLARTVAKQLSHQTVKGKLWIAQPGRIRERYSADPEDS